MTWRVDEPNIVYQAIADTDTTQNHALGKIVRAKNDSDNTVGEFIYLKGVASTVAGSWVTYDIDSGTTTLLVADAIGPVAVAMSANVASQYGWYQINGEAAGVGSTVSIADSADLYATATGGVAGSTVVTGDRIWGAKASSATSDGTVTANINRPFVTNAVESGTS